MTSDELNPTPCWYVKDFADDWVKFYDQDCAIAEAKETGGLLYYSPDGKKHARPAPPPDISKLNTLRCKYRSGVPSELLDEIDRVCTNVDV